MLTRDFRHCSLQAEIGESDVLKRALEVRHKVFVLERGFEKDAGCKHDAHALHAVFNCGGQSAGSVRLILANPQQTGYLFPFQQAFRRSGQRIPNQPGIKTDLLAETSRLAVVSSFRTFEDQTRIADALILAALHAGVRLGLPGGYILVEQRLANHLVSRVGLTLQKLAGPVNLNGQRFAYWVPGGDHQHSFTPRVQDVFAWVKSQLDPCWPQIQKTELVAGLAARLPEKRKKVPALQDKNFRLAAA
jgi:hypothetical protein